MVDDHQQQSWLSSCLSWRPDGDTESISRCSWYVTQHGRLPISNLRSQELVMPRLARELFASTLVVAWTREARHVQPNFGENPLCRSATDAVIYIQFYCHINSRFHRLEKPPLFGTIETYRSRGNPISMLLSPVLANELYTASMRFSNTAVQRLLVQQPIQQRQRTSAKNNSTQRTYNADFKHKMDTGERLRTTCVESSLPGV